MTTLYISGPMTGYKGHNLDTFLGAEIALKGAGYEVLNPAHNPPQPCWEDYLRLDIAMVCQADGIATLPGWEMSAGAQLEVHVAHALHIPVLSVSHWYDKARRSVTA